MGLCKPVCDMTDRELIAEWHTMSGDGKDTARAAMLADEMALRNIDFWPLGPARFAKNLGISHHE